jgi:putative inorganic carbon (hco3(-)) transporter
VNAASTTKWIYLTSGLFLSALLTSLYFENYLVLLLPVALSVIWAAFYRLEYLVLLVVMCTPFSINLEELELGGIGMYLPTEPLLAGILVIFLLKVLSGKSIDKRIFRHPVSLVIYAYLAWMALTCITSEMPLISLKYLTTRLWFIASFFFITTHIFMDYKRIRSFFLLYLFPLIAVVIYTITRHSFYGFDKDSSHWVMEPLFKDHTSYGAVLAMYFPVTVGLLLSRKMSPLLRAFLTISFVILSLGLILSYTRAAWISVIGAGFLLGLMVFRVPMRAIVISVFLASTFFYLGREDIQVSLQKNKQESSDRLDEHVGSISNVSSDASNLERLNRWNCAWEMFMERPVFGWGPGTYQFVYAPFQRARDKTIISTNRGDGGNAHSEYLGPLSEQGAPGMILMIALVAVVSKMSFRLFYSAVERETKIAIGSAFLGLVTYFIHGVLNNYLDTDKASVPFWGFIAVLTAIDLFHNKANGSAESPQKNLQVNNARSST